MQIHENKENVLYRAQYLAALKASVKVRARRRDISVGLSSLTHVPVRTRALANGGECMRT